MGDSASETRTPGRSPTVLHRAQKVGRAASGGGGRREKSSRRKTRGDGGRGVRPRIHSIHHGSYEHHIKIPRNKLGMLYGMDDACSPQRPAAFPIKNASSPRPFPFAMPFPPSFLSFAPPPPRSQFLRNINIWDKRTERPNVAGVPIRSKNGAPSRKGAWSMAKRPRQAKKKSTPPPA